MSIYDASYIGTATNRVNFNGSTFPIFRVQSRAPSSRAVRELDIPIPFESGISDFETLEGRSAYVLQGTMYPGGESQYDSGLAQLRKLASLEIEQDDTDSDEGYVPYVFTEFSQQKQIFLKVLYVDIPESTRKGLVQPFRLVCKVKDPTIFSVGTSLATTQSVNPTLQGGTAVFPFAYSIVYGASTYSASSVANNIGDLPGYPISIKVFGPINTPTITNSTTGESITVNTNLASSSNILLIAYDKDSLSVTNSGVSVQSSVTDASTYFKLQPGNNSITLSGSSLGSGAYVEVLYYSTWPLS